MWNCCDVIRKDSARTRTRIQRLLLFDLHKHFAAMSTRTTTIVQARPSGYSPRQRFLGTLILTALLGTTLSVLQTSAATTAFRSRLPAHTLSRLTSSASASAFPVPSLPYFADKVSLKLLSNFSLSLSSCLNSGELMFDEIVPCSAMD